jgi:glucose-1-phosphate adenylyltransferase
VNNVHGIIYAYHAFPELKTIGARRTGAALPFCGRYRLIDFALSGMMHAGVRNVGVIMQRGYLSLMEHIAGGRSWNLERHSGGLHLLPPYSLAEATKGVYEGGIEALSAVYPYLVDNIRPGEYVLLTRGDLCANVDMKAVLEAHFASGADITAVCTTGEMRGQRHSFVPGPDGVATEMLSCQSGQGPGAASLEVYVLQRELLLELVGWSREHHRLHFHQDALTHAMAEGKRIKLFYHEGYAMHVTSELDYYRANMDMLDPDKRRSLFIPERRIITRSRSDVATYYGDSSRVKNCLVADGCRIEGTVENSLIFRGVTIAPGAEVRNCVILNDTVIGENAHLNCVISDKEVRLSPYLDLSGSEKLPLAIPKGSII